MQDQLDPYKILGVEPDADDAEIKSAYRSLIRQYHPDINPDPTSTEQAKRITEAYRQIGMLRSEPTSIWDQLIDDEETETAPETHPTTDAEAPPFAVQMDPDEARRWRKGALWTAAALALLAAGLFAWSRFPKAEPAGLIAPAFFQENPSLSAVAISPEERPLRYDLYLLDLSPIEFLATPAPPAERENRLDLVRIQSPVAARLETAYRRLAQQTEPQQKKRRYQAFANHFAAVKQWLNLKERELKGDTSLRNQLAQAEAKITQTPRPPGVRTRR